MKLNREFVLRQVADMWVVLPIGSASVNFNSMLTLNESGVVLWHSLEQGGSRQDLADALLREYEVDTETALADVDEFLDRLFQAGCLEME